MNCVFSTETQRAYLDVHSWLQGLESAKGYRCLYPPNIKSALLKDVAAQFGCYFPAHYFKTIYVFSEIIGREKFLDWLELCTALVIVDLGCGSGAATVATIAQLIELHDVGELNRDFVIYCIGVDPTPSALGIYYKIMSSLKECLGKRSIGLEIHVVYKSIAEGISEIDDILRVLLKSCVQPAFSNVILLQSNVVDPLKDEHEKQLKAQEYLRDLQVPCEVFESESDFGSREARAYHQLFRHVPLDRQLLVTVGTDSEDIRNLVFAMGKSIFYEFSKFRPVRIADDKIYRVDYHNPLGSYWKECKNKDAYSSKFYTDIMAVENSEVEGDVDWHRVIAVENLELAWARARALLQREVLYDEIEIRLFERNLQANLKRLHQELVAYDINVASTKGRLQFRFVKNEKEDAGRPRVLSRIEEEIVSIAIVQELGAAAFGLNSTSFAYRPNPRFASRSEFLYEYWFSAYQRYKTEVFNAVDKHSNCRVISIDIKSYFTGIAQQSLVEAVQKEMRTQSARIRWLLERLLCVELESHDPQRGLTQGGAGSGFYANAYLTAFDKNFGINNLWEAKLFRFVDDIVIVVPDPTHLEDVKLRAESALNELDLEMNLDKSDDFGREEYLNLPQDKGIMNDLSERFDQLTKPLWRTNSHIRQQLEDEAGWWSLVTIYRDHLHSIGHYIEPHRLSRKLDQYVEKCRAKREDREKNQRGLALPPLDAIDWASKFTDSNGEWLKDRDTLRKDIIERAIKSFEDLGSSESSVEQRLQSTRIYFCANRLARLGYGDAIELFTEILLSHPWIIRQPQYVIRGLAIQGFVSQVERLFNHYRGLENTYTWASSFLAVIIRAIRHLNEVPESLETDIIHIALDENSTPVLRLLATETWLIKLDCWQARQHESRIQQLIDHEQCARVKKNFLLLLAKCKKQDNLQILEYEDSMLESAMRLALEGSVEELFADVEPKILRERYYSRYYPDNFSEFGDDGPY